MSEKGKLRKDALEYHSRKPKGKIEVLPTKPHTSQRDLSLAYSPGVAEPCLAISDDKSKVYDYTSKGNLVAVISNGTAVLGLGDIGPEASKPVMEGKGLLFKIFADIDVFDIEINENDPNKFVEIVKAISPTFGGINLEDIKSPEAFIIEKRLKEELQIPVMHDDQHGTAIISAAALINALEVAQKDIKKVKIVVNGAGAAAIACSNLYIKLGAQKENIIMCDSKGVIHDKREDLNDEKKLFQQNTSLRTLEDALKNADVFIGLSVGNIMTTEMLLSMSDTPIVFAMANPDPEIDYKLAVSTRKDVIMATGRSDFPNQVNNVLGFPFIFRGALDVQATQINEVMKLAAVKAIAELAKEAVPEVVLLAYNLEHLNFGKDYLIPKPFDQRLITKVSMAVARSAMESGVAQKPIEDWNAYEQELSARLGNDVKLIRMMQNRAKANPKTIALSNAEELAILKAAQFLHEEGIAKPILLGRKEQILQKIKEYDLDINLPIEDPHAVESESKRKEFSELLWKKRKRKGISLYQAERLVTSRDYYGPMMVECGYADALLSGYSKSYSATLKPAIECIGKAEEINKIAGLTMILRGDKPLFFADTSVNEEPTWEDLVRIAKMSHWVVRRLGILPRIAMISYENFAGKSLVSQKMAKAVKYLHEHEPDMIVDGEIQADFALKKESFESFPFSKLGENAANILLFPNLVAANAAYKVLRGINAAQTVGPILLGLKKPAHIMQMRANIDEIINLATVAVLDAQNRK